MKEALDQLLSSNQIICENISNITTENRLFCSKNICGHIRHLIDHIAEYIYIRDKNIMRDSACYDHIKKAHEYISTQGKYRLLSRLHKWFQISVSHYSPSGDNAERLMLKYYPKFIELKNFMTKNYQINILENLKYYPLDIDKTLQDYYLKIVEKIPRASFSYKPRRYHNTYYIQRIKPFFINSQIYYEITFNIANDYASKFDRIIAFTKLEILPNYAVKFKIREECIILLDKNIPVLIIDDWEVSILAKEFKNFAKILDINVSIPLKSKESKNFRRFLTKYQYTLAELAQLPTERYERMKALINGESNCEQIFSILDKCHQIIQTNSSGNNVLSYLLHTFNNTIIRKQYKNEYNRHLSRLKLDNGCIPFETMPYNTSLLAHNPRFSDLLECIPVEEREHELLARYIKNNTENIGELYTDQNELTHFNDINDLIFTYNNCLYSSTKHQKRRLELYNNHIYI